jgi:hypothetical protein
VLSQLFDIMHIDGASTMALPLEVPRGARFVQPKLDADVQYLAASDALRHAVLREVCLRES